MRSLICRWFGHKRPLLDAVTIEPGQHGTAYYIWTCTRCGTQHVTTFSDDIAVY